jgi:Zn-dependent membrane protease YugP
VGKGELGNGLFPSYNTLDLTTYPTSFDAAKLANVSVTSPMLIKTSSCPSSGSTGIVFGAAMQYLTTRNSFHACCALLALISSTWPT